MKKEFPEVFRAIDMIINNQDLYYLDLREYYLGCRMETRHPLIRIADFWFMKFGEYFLNDKYILFHVSVIGTKDPIGVLKFADNKLYFYRIDNENNTRDFSIKLLDELYDEFTLPYLNKLEKIKSNSNIKKEELIFMSD